MFTLFAEKKKSYLPALLIKKKYHNIPWYVLLTYHLPIFHPHLMPTPLPQPKQEYAAAAIERAFEVLKRAIDAGRLIRDRNTLPTKYPLKELVVVCKVS